MPTFKFAEVQLLRRRALGVDVTSSATIYWDPFNEGGYLSIRALDTTTSTLDFTMPPGKTSGLEFWVDFWQGHSSGGASINWPGTFRFQTVGDALPNSTYEYLTKWHGYVVAEASGGQLLMTKIGEWFVG
jgi:hypothetical protein